MFICCRSRNVSHMPAILSTIVINLVYTSQPEVLRKTPQTFLRMLLDVNTTPREYNFKVTFKAPETEYCEDIEQVILD